MDFNQYDKISDIVMRIGFNAVLKFNVALSNQDKNKNRRFCYSEYEYKSSKYGQNLVTIKRDADYYLSIENIVAPQNTSKAFIRIDNIGIVKLKSALQYCYEWFTSEKYSNLFMKSKGRLMMDADRPNFAVTDLPMGKYLLFEPCIVERGGTSSDLYPGLSVYLGDKYNVVDMDVNMFYGFKNMIDTFNMYLAYSMLMNSIFGRSDTEPFNRVNMDNQPDNRGYTPKTSNTYGVTGRTIKPVTKLEDMGD